MSNNVLQTVTELLQSIDSSLDSPWNYTSTKAAPVVYHLQYDALTASCALFRLYDSDPEANGTRGYMRWMELDDPGIVELITPEDQSMANTIRDYYSKQLVVARLQNEREFSKYMKCLAKIVTETGNQYTSDDRGIYYRLPEYFTYDIAWDQMIDDNFKDYSNEHLLKRERTLRPVKRMTRRNRSEKITELWFSDVNTNQPVSLAIQSSNQLGYIVEQLFDRGNNFKISTTKPVESTRRGNKFMTSEKWKITNLDEL